MMVNKLKLLVFVTSLLSSFSIAFSANDSRKWNDIYEELLQSRGSNLSPKQVLERLQRTNELYKSLDSQAIDKERASELANLLEVYNLAKANCNFENFKHVEVLVEKYCRSTGTKHIISYLMNVYSKLSNKCKEDFPKSQFVDRNNIHSTSRPKTAEKTSDIGHESGFKKARKKSVRGSGFDRWVKLYRRIFGSKGPSLQPNEVLEQLRELDKLYKEVEPKEVDTEVQRVASYVSRLIKIQSFIGVDCQQKYIDEIQDLIEEHQYSKVNILPYLGSSYKNHKSSCKSKYFNSLRRAVDDLTPAVRADLASLQSYVSASTPNQQMISYIANPKLAGGIVKFIESKAGILNKKIGRDDFARKYKNFVAKACDPVIKGISPVIKDYKSIMAKDGGFIKDDFNEQWKKIGGTCELADWSSEMTIDMCLEWLKYRDSSEKNDGKKQRKGFHLF